jgi:phosphoribosylanthranilate isomerase
MAKVRIKICGVTAPEDVRAIAELGADAVGLNFYPKSPRYIDPRNAAELLRSIPPMMDAVGVFVGLKTRQVCALAYQLGLRSVQCFGEIDDVEDSYPFQRIAAFRVKDRSSLDEIDLYLEKCRSINALPAALLADAHVEGQLGGTGQTAPWDLLAKFRPGIPLILAGGLTPEIVAEAIRTVRPFAVDVASGVESSPGKKDLDTVRRFIDAVHTA